MRAVPSLLITGAAGLSVLLAACSGVAADTDQSRSVVAPMQFTEQTKVAKVADGDSFYVVGRDVPIRMIGIDAPDKSTGDCYYDEATAALERLIDMKRKVTLSAENRKSFSVGNGMKRPLRYVNQGGRDLSMQMLQQGYAVFNTTMTERAREVSYANAAQLTASKRLRIWSSTLCGPAPPAALRIFVNYNADRLDTQNIGGKYVRIVNDGPPLYLRNWRLRLGNRKYYTIGSITLQTGQSLVLHNGSGASYIADGDQHMFWGFKIDLPDPRTSLNKVGAVYLQDPSRNYRFWSIWPCIINCTSDPVIGKLGVQAIYHPPEGPMSERILVTNTSAEPVDASFLVVEAGSSVFEIPRGNVLQPGQSLTIWVQPHGGDYTLNRDRPTLSDDSDSVLLRGNDGKVIATHDW